MDKRAIHSARLLTVEEAAEALNTPPRFVRRLVEERRIPFHKLGRHVRIAEADLTAYIAAGRVEPIHLHDTPWREGKAA